MFMQKIHQDLIDKGGVYAKWHNYATHEFLHWFILIAIIAITSISLVSQTQAYMTDFFLANTIGVSSANSSSMGELNKGLLMAIKRYGPVRESEDLSQKYAGLSKVAELAKERETALLRLMENNPRLAEVNLFPPGLISKLPPEVQVLLEQEVEVSGELIVTHVDYFEEDRGEFVYELKTEDRPDRPYRLHFARGAPELYTGSKIKVKGNKVGESILMAATDGPSLVVVAAIPAGPTGDQKVLAMLINFTNYTSQPWTPAQVAGQLFTDSKSTNAYYKETSFDLTNFSGDVTNWITVPYTNENCNTMYSTWANAADSAATALGYNLGNYNRKLYTMAGASGCGFAGRSTVGGNPSRSWTNNYNSATLNNHELGHAIGMYHASTIRCGTKAIDVYTNCTGSEYGDVYDTMGSWNTYHLNGAHKVQQTYVPAARVQTVTTSGTYTIAPLETLTASVQVLKISKPNTTNFYYIDYRQPIGFDSGLPAGITSGAGVVIHPGKLPSIGSSNTLRVDTTPSDAVSNSALADGRTFQDDINGITITQLSHNSTSATVQVTFGPAVCAKGKPTVSISPASKQGSAGDTLSYTLFVTNNDTSSCANTTFSTSISGLPAGFTYSTTNLSLPPGANGSSSFTVTSPSGQPDGSYTFTATAADTGDPAHSNTADAAYVVFTDTIAPTVNIISPTDGSNLGKGKNVNIKVTATDNVKVALLELFIDGIKVSSINSGSLTYRWNTGSVASGSHNIVAKAQDSSGNVSQASITVTK
jgi:hypothetical protein